jgi:hypothetical protein
MRRQLLSSLGIATSDSEISLDDLTQPQAQQLRDKRCQGCIGLEGARVRKVSQPGGRCAQPADQARKTRHQGCARLADSSIQPVHLLLGQAWPDRGDHDLAVTRGSQPPTPDRHLVVTQQRQRLALIVAQGELPALTSQRRHGTERRPPP